MITIILGGYPMKKLIIIMSSFFLASCSVFGIRTTKEPDYQVLEKYEQIEIRYYPALIIAETKISGDYKQASKQGFQRLAGYIFGDNKQKLKLDMTTPVMQEQEAESETISMTAPVIQEKIDSSWVMAFVLPEEYLLATVPEPTDPAVLIKQLPEKTVAVLQYSGSLADQTMSEKAEQLNRWLIDNAYHPISAYRSAAYDPPWTLPFLRRNEIHIDIQAVK